MHTLYSDVPKFSIDAQRLVILGYLITLRKIRVKIVLSVKFGLFIDRASQSKPQHDCPLNCFFVWDRKRPWQPQTYWTCLRIGFFAKVICGAAAKHLGGRCQFYMHLKADDRFKCIHALRKDAILLCLVSVYTTVFPVRTQS